MVNVGKDTVRHMDPMNIVWYLLSLGDSPKILLVVFVCLL